MGVGTEQEWQSIDNCRNWLVGTRSHIPVIQSSLLCVRLKISATKFKKKTHQKTLLVLSFLGILQETGRLISPANPHEIAFALSSLSLCLRL